MNVKQKIYAAGKFVKENKLLMLQLGMMGAVVLTNDVSFASQADDTFSVVTTPTRSSGRWRCWPWHGGSIRGFETRNRASLLRVIHYGR